VTALQWLVPTTIIDVLTTNVALEKCELRLLMLALRFPA
jgi:hypothetical protein